VRLKKSVVKNFGAVLLGSVIVLTMSKGVPWIVSGRTQTIQAKTMIENIATLKTEEKYTGIDVVAIGNSDLYSAFNPQQLWDEQGIPSYVAAGPNTNVYTSLCMLEGVLACQKPQLVILEVDEFFEKKGITYLGTATNLAYENCYGLFSQNKNLLKCPLINQYRLTQSRVISNRGYENIATSKPYYGKFSYMVPSDQREPVNAVTEKYLPQLISLAQEHDCEILFVCMPSASSWTYAKHNTVSDLADEYGIPFIDFNVDQYDTGFDWVTDTRDGGNHLNYSGATKMTKYLGKYLQEHYQLSDHRNDQDYADWNS